MITWHQLHSRLCRRQQLTPYICQKVQRIIYSSIVVVGVIAYRVIQTYLYLSLFVFDTENVRELINNGNLPSCFEATLFIMIWEEFACNTL